MKRISLFIILGLFAVQAQLAAKEVTFLQYLYTIKQIFPELNECSVLIEKDLIAERKSKIDRASAQMKIKVVLYPIENAKDIGRSLKNIPQNGVLIVFNSPLLTAKSTKLFVLSKCKEKKVALVTSSKDYVDAGALIGLLPNDKNKTDLIVNLKHSQYLAAKFTDDFVKSVGIKTLIQ